MTMDKGGAATFNGKEPEAEEEILGWRAVDLEQKEIEKGMNRYTVNPFPNRLRCDPD